MRTSLLCFFIVCKIASYFDRRLVPILSLVLMSLFVQKGWSQDLASSSANGSSTTTSDSFVDVTGASVSISANAGTKVLVTASFSGKTLSGNTIGAYRLVDDESQRSGELEQSHNGTYSIGSVVYLFDVTTTGVHTYKFQHKTTEQILESNVAITAVGLYDGVNLLKNNVKTLAAPIEMTSSTFESAMESEVVTTTANGGFYVSASVQTANTVGSGLVVGEWRLQYKYGSAGSWENLGYPMSRSTSGTGIGIVNLVAALPNTQIAGNYYFRVAHRKISGTDTYETQAGNLVAVALGTNNGYFPVLITSKSSATNPTANFTDVISNNTTSLSPTSLFLHAQYNMSATASIDAPMFDIFVKQGVTTVLDGLDHLRYLSSSTDSGSGASIGLLSGMNSGVPYNISLRHASVGTATLTTRNAYLVGFGTNRSSLPLVSPITVYATEGLSNSSFSTLKEAFDAINAGAFNGNITVQINASITETATAELFGSGTNNTNYNAVSIYPTTSGVSIAGNLAAPLISLNGADNVTIDGRINGVGSTKNLNFINANTGGSVIQLINDATENILKYCTIQGVTSSVTSGLVVFGASNLIGNDNNTIQYCDIRDGASTPTNAIYSSGSSIVADNSGITISNNNIYNYFSPTTASNGIFIAANSAAWTIDNNRFYQTETRVSISGTSTSIHRGINIVTASGVNYTVQNNIIGYGDALETNMGYTTYSSGFPTTFRGIEMIVGSTSASSVQGNIISNIDFSTTSGLTTGAGVFSGISILGGQVDIGTIQGNMIGSSTETGFITISSTTSGSLITGIYSTSTSDVAIQNNKIGAISTSGAAGIGYTFRGINSVGVGGNYTISSNIIGSTTTSNSVTIGLDGITTAVCRFDGINNSASGTISISNNTVQNTSVYGTGLSVYYGIVNTGGTGTLDILRNSIVSGTNTGSHSSTTVTYFPIYNSAAVATLNINNNIIKNHQRTQVLGYFTAIANAGLVLSAININDNRLGDESGGLINYSAASTATLLGISNTAGAASCELSIKNNDIRGITYSAGITGANAHTYIINSAATLKQNISNNTFTNLNVNTTGAIIFISNNVTMPSDGVQNIDENSIVGTYTRVASSGAITLFTSATLTNNTGVTVTNNNNNFSNITINGTATISGWINTDAGTGNVNKTIEGNIFNNWTGGTGAITALNVNITSLNNETKGNTVSNVNNAGTIYGIITAAGNDNIFLNTINNLKSEGGAASTIVSGINVTSGITKNIYNNTISNLTGNTLTTGSVRGILISAGSTVNFYQNTIYGITANANTTGTVSGVWVTGSNGSIVNIDQNKIYDISSTSTVITSGFVQGIQTSGSATATANLVVNISNNLISDIKTHAMSLANAVRGISILSLGTTSTNNVYFNTIYLNTTSIGTNFGSAGIHHSISTTVTTGILNLRNNIIVNLSTPKGTGQTVAFRRSGGAANNLNNYAFTSNNNLFYAGVPGPNNLIYADGISTAQTLAAYKAGVFAAGTMTPRDQASVTENPTFKSILPTSPDFLHINTSITTQIESGAVNIDNFTNDYDGNIRQGNNGYIGASTTAPDIGADEGDFTPEDKTAPAISYVILTNNSCVTNQIFSAIITDGTGVNTAPGTKPYIYFKKSTNLNILPATNTNTTDGWKFVEASNSDSPFNFTIDYGLIFGGVTSGSVIQYFIVAQDIIEPTPYIGINKGIFAATPISVNLTSAAFPIGGVINSFTLLAGLNGTVTVGSGGNYPTLTGTGGLFEDLNTKGMSANLTATIISDITEPGTVSLNAITYGCDAYNTLTISPSGGSRVLSGVKDGGALINFNGADYVVIDGLNTGGNSLTISNASTSNTAGTSTIRFIADASNNIVRNCTIEGSSMLIASGTILFSTGISTGNDENHILNNIIKPAGTNLPTNAVYSAGTSIVVDNSGNIIENNEIVDYFNPILTSNGIFIASNSSEWSIIGNKLYQTSTRTGTTNATHRAIQILTASGVNYEINNNIIGYANASSTGITTYNGAVNNLFRSIELTVGTLSASNVQGNIIGGISFSTTSGLTTTAGIFTGISVLAGTVNIGTTTGNSIGSTTGIESIHITSTTSLGAIVGIYASSTSLINIQNNSINAIYTAGTFNIGYTFNGIYTAGGGQFNVTNNTIGNTNANSIAIGTLGTTTSGVCTLYGIRNTSTGGISISGNTIQNISSYGTTASILYGILNSGVGQLVSIENNIISKATNNGTGTMVGIINSAAATNLEINANTIKELRKSVAYGTVLGISNTGGVLASTQINNNKLGDVSGGFITYSVANPSSLTGISNTAGTSNCELSIAGNDIRGITYDVVGTNTHNYIINSAATLSQNISSNTFTNLSVNTTGAIVFILNNVIMPANGIQNINGNNIVTGFTRTAASGVLTLFTSTSATGNSNVVVNNNNNNFSNINLNGVAIISGWINTDTGVGNVTKTIDGNTFSNWTAGTGTITALNVNITSTNNATKNNTISNITSTGNITGITTAAGNDYIFSNTIHALVSTEGTTTVVNGIAITAGTVKNAYENTIYNLQANNISTGTVNGISISGGLLNYIYRNKIYDISSSSNAFTGSVNGILVSGKTADLVNIIYNNRIGDLRATAANTADAIRGISIANTGVRSLSNVYFNTVYLNAISTGTNFGTSGLYHAANITATTGALNLRNNIILNNSTPNGTGRTVAFRRSSGAVNSLKNYSTLSNNNLFFAGTPSSTNLIFTDGVGIAETILQYKSSNFTSGIITPRDQLSITELSDFLSVDGSSIDFLKLNANKISFAESGAENISGITTDFEGEIRAGNPGFPVQTNGSGTAPDIGADEFDGKTPNILITNAHSNTNGGYTSLRQAFEGINAEDQSGNDILVSIIGNSNENTTAILHQGAWNSMRIFPSKANLSIIGSIENAPLIDLNGADNVTFDGRINQMGSTKSLIISNTSVSSLSTSTVRFTNSAQNNTVKYTTVLGSTLSTTDGIITFGTSSSELGNNSNIIEYCNISNAEENRAINSVFSMGSAGSENNLNSISNTNFYNFLNPSNTSNGIHLKDYSSDWIITNNSFYETTTFVPIGSSLSYNAIRIDAISGNNFSITNNYIGGKEVSSEGGNWTVNANTDHYFRAIYLNVGTLTASSVQNNHIQNWNYTAASANPWRGIEVNNGTVNIGTVTGNIIGATTGTGSISLTSSVNAQSDAIYIGSPSTIVVSKNSIGSINIFGSTDNVVHSFTGIYKKTGVAGSLTISKNIIGSSTTTQSIYCGSAATSASVGQHLLGIYLESTGTNIVATNTIVNLNNNYSGSQISRTRGVYSTAGTNTLTKNTIYNLSSNSINNTVGSVIGVEMNGIDGVNIITETSIYNLLNTNASFNGNMAGIYFTGNNGVNLVNRNFIRNISVNANTNNTSIYGVRMVSGAATYANNIISLNVETKTTVYGIYGIGTSGNNSNIYFNTVYISGSLENGATNKSYAFYGADNANIRDIRNNIFSNFRSTIGGNSLHYAIYLNYAGASNLSLNYNQYYASGEGGVPGFYNGLNGFTIPIVATKDANSVIDDPKFVLNGGSNATDYKLRESINGVFGTGIILDYGQTARGNPPNIGAWEFNANRWLGTIDTDFANAANWSAGAVPLEETDVVFAIDPVNSCVLDMNRTIGSIVNTQPTYNFVTNGKELTLLRGLFLSGGAKIDATSVGTKLIFQGEEVQIIPDAAFVGNTIPYVTINNIFGVTTEGSFTITDTLNLLSNNPSDTVGCLDTGNNIITLGGNAVTIGDGDVTGIIKRTNLTYNKTYTFGNKNATLYFVANGNPLPTTVSVKTTIGMASTWRPNSINRIYEFIQTGADPLLPTAATISGAYLDSELNGNDENKLVFQSYRIPPGLFYEHGRSSNNPDENWVKLTNVNMAFFPATLGSLQLSLGLTELETLTWNGSVSNSWTTVNNWTPNGAPSDFVNIIIPDATTTPNDPLLPPLTKIKTLKMENGAILNSFADAEATIMGGEGAWTDEGGTFNSGTSTVIFENEAANFSGTSSFNNITIVNGANLYMTDASYLKLSGVMNNIGGWFTSLSVTLTPVTSTVEYNGGNQVVVIPNPATNRYSSLILSNTGIKTMSPTILSVLENFTITGTASATANNNMVIGGNVTIKAEATFNSGSKDLSISGNINHDGTFDTTGSTITLDGETTQTISGTATTTSFENLIISNMNGVTATKNISINASIELLNNNPSSTKGCLDMDVNTLFMGASAITTGEGDVSGIVQRSHTFNPDQIYTFGNENTFITFGISGTLPSTVSIKTTLGEAPTWKTNAINRVYEFVQTGGIDCISKVSVNYLDSELNDNQEDLLVYWGVYFPSLTPIEMGFSNRSVDSNWLLLENINIGLWPSNFGELEITLANTSNPHVTWNGSISTDWNNPRNWTPNAFINLFSYVIIPDADTTPRDPILPLISDTQHIHLNSGSILNASSNAVLNLYGKNEISWTNMGGTFNPNTSTVNFMSLGQKISGDTNFYNISIKSDAEVILEPSSIVRIAGTLLNEGIFDATQNINTIEFNGNNQVVDIPNGTNPGFHHLTLSGSETKIMPLTDIQVYGDFSVEGSASTTSSAEMNIVGNLNIGNGATWNTGVFNHIIEGNLTINGNFITPLNSSIRLAGNSIQNISGTALINFENLTENNLAHVNLNADISIDGLLTLSEGQLIINDNTLSVSGTINALNGKLNVSTLSSLTISGVGDYTFSPNLFTTHPSIKDLTLNRNGIVHSTNQNLTINNALNLTLGTLDIDNNVFTMIGNTLSKVNGNIEAGNVNDMVVFANVNPIVLPNATFIGKINNLTIQGAGGVTSLGDLAINKVLNLQAENPSDTKGILDLNDGVDLKTLTMGLSATTVGVGDVTGIVRRTDFLPNINYTLGNQFTYVSFLIGGTYPSELKVKIQIGIAPTWQTTTTPIQRIYDFIQVGGNNCIASITSHYLDSELNGNIETNLSHWTFGANGQQPAGAYEWGSSDYNTTNNWVTINNVFIQYFPTVFGNLENTLAASNLLELTWNGSINTTWENLNNWTPLGIPSALSKVIIANADSTLNDPTLATSVTILQMSLQSGAILNGSTDALLSIVGDNGAWDNQGGIFNPNTSTVTFNNPNAIIGGTTNFYNLVIPANYSLTMLSNSYISIAGSLTNNGVFNTIAVGGTTVEYNGNAQTVANSDPLNPLNNHYYDLILNGVGTKMLPNKPLYIRGSMHMLGSALTTVNELLTIDGGLNLSGTSEIIYNSNSSIEGGMNVSDAAKMVLNADKSLTIAGTITNTVGTSGIVLKSNANGTASLIHNSNNIPATVERFISGIKEDWHFLSSPVSNQTIAGSNWTPSGSYGNGTGYDLYVWDEPASCWVYHKNDVGILPNDPLNPKWPTIHPLLNFVSERGYLYSVQELNPTKEFKGNLNNGNITYSVTANNTADALLKGFNLVGNPYPSSIDWKIGSGWSRTNLETIDGSYNMWIWNPAADNYGLCNSANDVDPIFTNGVTQYIPPMQGFFVRAASNGNLGMSNLIRVHDGASNWMKPDKSNLKLDPIKIRISSNNGFGFDEVLLMFESQTNRPGAAKLRSSKETSLSVYLPFKNKEYTVQYFTDTISNQFVPLNFEAGAKGDYSMTFSFDSNKYATVLLEDKITKTFHDVLENPTYNFSANTKDKADRFVIHFSPISKVKKELPINIYYNGNDIVVDLTLISGQTEVNIYDMLGRKILSKNLQGQTIHYLPIIVKSQVYIVSAKSINKFTRKKVLVY